MVDEQVHRAYVALGSNLGDRAAALEAALRALDETERIALEVVSSFYETAPMYVSDQPVFLNACAEVSTSRTPESMLDELMRIERELGRVRDVDKGPRTIDLDLIAFGGEVRATDTLTLPHPGLPERAFVLVPLREIAPQWVHPVLGASVAELDDAHGHHDEVRRVVVRRGA
ncbi:MAG: 2-amino-4-hydroxy-6-hydroxymethyldihydropteridine diphosphokinase [Myxococcota bacterium]